jgi:RNA polymerase sigma-70 factor (ECF subfamily)
VRKARKPVNGFRKAGKQEKYVEYRVIAQAFDQLPIQQYAAIMLVALESLVYDEAAWILSVPVGALRSRLARGRETLRTLRLAPPLLDSEASIATQ